MSSKVALVTGASRGIGRAIALGLAESGWSVAINYSRNRDAAEEAKREVESRGGRGLIVQADISSADDRKRLVDETANALGPIELLVNNAGVAPDVRADMLEATSDSFDRLININLKGPYFLTQLVAREMIRLQHEKKIDKGRIAFVTSVSAYATSINRGDYCVSKAGLSMASALWAHRLAEYHIPVIEIRPGIIATDMTAGVKEKYDRMIADGLTLERRWGQPQDVGRAAAALARGDLPYATGQVVNIDGGMLVGRL